MHYNYNGRTPYEELQDAQDFLALALTDKEKVAEMFGFDDDEIEAEYADGLIDKIEADIDDLEEAVREYYDGWEGYDEATDTWHTKRRSTDDEILQHNLNRDRL